MSERILDYRGERLALCVCKRFRIARKIGGNLVATVGRLDVTPNIPNAIPGRVGLSVDFRDPGESTLDRALSMLDRVVRDAARREGVRAEVGH